LPPQPWSIITEGLATETKRPRERENIYSLLSVSLWLYTDLKKLTHSPAIIMRSISQEPVWMLVREFKGLKPFTLEALYSLALCGFKGLKPFTLFTLSLLSEALYSLVMPFTI
jgi:hypothetical protein